MERLAVDFSRSTELRERLAALVPGGGHTYAKGADQYPQESPGVLVRGEGCHVWDADGNEFIEYGMGLRSVGLGHAYPEVIRAVQESLSLGTNFSRPAAMELDAAEVLAAITGTDMVKFTKDGSTATTAALKLARKSTGRELVAVCREHPFFSYDDWFIGTTTMDGGIPSFETAATVRFSYNDLASVRTLFEEHPDGIAAVFLEAARSEPPAEGFLEELRRLCTAHGTVLVFDEMITGFRYDLHGAQHLYGVEPDLSTWGKAMANGFSLSALCGKSELMALGSRRSPGDDVFLLSTTHGAELCSLAAGMATMAIYQREPVIEHFYRQGEALRAGFLQRAQAHGVAEHVAPFGFPCNLLFSTTDPDGQPSQAYRTLFLQEVTRRGILMPSLVISYSHSDEDVERTLDAIDGALGVYAKALSDGTDRFLVGPPSRHVMDFRPG